MQTELSSVLIRASKLDNGAWRYDVISGLIDIDGKGHNGVGKDGVRSTLESAVAAAVVDARLNVVSTKRGN